MPATEFGEGQYEQDLVETLKRVHGAPVLHFRPTGVLEEDVGFDIAMTVSPSLMLPRRSVTLAGTWTDGSYFKTRLPRSRAITLPCLQVNSFLQMKVPYHVTRKHKRTVQQWARWKAAYFRLSLDDDQHGKLVALEQAMQSNALVRYVAPCFSTWADLRTRVLAGTTVQESHFQSPGRLGGHLTYTYRTSQGPGIAFSQPEDMPSSHYLRDVREMLFAGRPTSLLGLVGKVWVTTARFREGTAFEAPASSDTAAARLLLGLHFEQHADPEGLVPEEEVGLLYGDTEPTFGQFAARLLLLERFFEVQFGSRWLIARL